MISPLSKTQNVSRISICNSRLISDLWRDQFDIDVGTVFKKLPRIELWRCRDTGLRWYEPSQAAGSGELYSQLEKFDWYYMRDKWEFEVARGLIESAKRVLEVGVGFGSFLESCRLAGINAVGVELNPTAANRVRENGFEIFEESLDDLANRIGKENFDAVCSFQVLEHVPQPREFIEGMLVNLKIGGRVILSVPNAAVMRRIDPENQELLNQPPHHMSHWDADVFKSLERFLPIKLRSVHREPLAQYHVDWIVSSYLRSRFNFLGRKLCRVLFNRITLFPIFQVLKMGPRKCIPGHTLLVELEKVG